MNARKKINKIRKRRAHRVRAVIFGTSDRPRLSVFKSNKYVYVQLIDDSVGKTIASASTRMESLKNIEKSKRAAALGEIIAKKAKEIGITKAVFDRGRYKYHGVIKSIVQEVRKNGLKI